MRLLLKLAGFVLVVSVAVFACFQLEIESMAPGVLAVFGSIFFFFGEYTTEGGFFFRGHYVDRGTPEGVWKTMGVIMWLISAGLIIWFAVNGR